MLCRIQKIPYRLREQFARSAFYTKPDDIDLVVGLAILHTFSGPFLHCCNGLVTFEESRFKSNGINNAEWACIIFSVYFQSVRLSCCSTPGNCHLFANNGID